MTAEQRWILDLTEVLSLRLDCAGCGLSIVLKPLEWRDPPSQCPGCGTFWERPYTAEEVPSPLQKLGMGLKQLLLQEKRAAKDGERTPFRVRIEISDPTMSRWEK
jgi:hypothetical protein